VTPDVRVRRCSLTIRRRTGWSWGDGADPYVEAALAGLEAALASALVEAGVDEPLDAVIEGPVRLQVGGDGVVSMASWTRLVEQLRELPAAEPAGASEGEPDDAEAEPAPDTPDRPGAAPVVAARASLAVTLARWSTAGQLARVVRSWPDAVLRAWVAAVTAAAEDGEERATPAALDPAAVGLIAGGVLGEQGPPPSEREAGERLLVVIGALAAALGGRMPDERTQAVARERVAGEGERLPVPRPEPRRPAPGAPDEVAPAAPEQRTAEPSLAVAPAQVVPALPLLVLAELSRIGYLHALAAAAGVAGLPGGGAALGAALAGKTLPPPARGWDREPAQTEAIALAAGRAPDWVPAGLAAVALREDALLPPLAAALQGAYAEGRSAHDEVVVTGGPHGLICGEAEGLLPAAWVTTDDELEAALSSLGDPPVRRGDDFLLLADALGERLALPRTGAAALERHLGAAAGTALGLLATDLWGGADDEPPTPLLALERLADLDARVEATPGGVVVGLPRGQRWLDLRRAGLLAPYVVPWLPGGRLEIATW
jgi:hypothetical protein